MDQPVESHPSSALVQVNEKRSNSTALLRLVRQCCPLSLLLYTLALEPILRRLRERTCSLALRRISVAGEARVRVSAYADDVSIFLLCRKEIEVMQKSPERYEKFMVPRLSLTILPLAAWKGVAFTGLFRWTDGRVRILRVWFGPDTQLEKNCSELLVKVGAPVWI